MRRELRFVLAIVLVASACGSAAQVGHRSAPSAGAMAGAESIGSDDLIVSTELVPLKDPGGYGAPAGSLWENVVYKDRGPAISIAAVWEAQQIALSAREQAAQNGDSPVVGVTYIVQDAPGNQTALNGGPFGGPPAKPREDLTQDELVKRVTDGLERLGLSLDSIAFEDQPHVGLAPIVVSTLKTDPTAFADAHPTPAGEIDVGGAPIYLEVLDPNGQPSQAEGLVPLSSTTMSWYDPGLGCVGDCPPQATHTESGG
jgi:hypothetical protein